MRSKINQLTDCLFVVAAIVVSQQLAFAQQSADQSAGTGIISSSGNGGSENLSFQADLFTGRFTYSIPIKVAPARQGAEPELTLGYNSAADNGWCGAGWSLETGYIQRDTRKGVPVQWGSTNPLPQYADSKGFVANIGGAMNTLVLVSPTNQNPVIYRQQADTAFLTCNYYNDNHWEVVDKSGNTFYFGEGTTNQMENTKTNWTQGIGASTFRWALDRVVDVNGNETFLKYTTDGGVLYLTNILYNANINSPALAATHEVDFILTNRPDTNIAFSSSYRVTSRQLLSEIDVKAGGANVRKYVLGYTQSPSTLRSLLTSVTEYGSDFTSALPPITFSYQVKPCTFGSATNWPGVYSQGDTGDSWNSIRSTGSGGETYVEMVDIDGDGLPDRVMRKYNSPYTNYFAIQRNTGTGFAPISTNYQWGHLDNVQGQTDALWNSPVDSDGNNVSVDIIDINGDGYPDRVMCNVVGPYTNWFVQLNTGVQGSNAFALSKPWFVTAQSDPSGSGWRNISSAHDDQNIDINGDGLPDRVMRNLNSPYDRFKVQLNKGSDFATNLVDWSGVWGQCITNNITGQILPVSDTVANSDTSGTFQGWFVILMDINGDGLPDRVMRQYNSPYTNFVVQFNNGAGFEPPENWGPINTNWGSPITYVGGQGDIMSTLIDINGDGLPDMLMHPYDPSTNNMTGQTSLPLLPRTNWLVQLNTGSGFAPAVSWSPIDCQGQTYEWDYVTHLDSRNTLVDFFDINGDGLPDRVMRCINAPYTNWVVQLNQGPFPDLLNVVSNGLGGSVQVSYVASTTLDNRNTNWVSDPWAEGTKSLLPFNVWVVSQISASDGMGNISTNTYAFKGGYYNAPEREFRGFSQATATDPLGTKTTTYFHQSGGRDNSALGEYLDQGTESKKGVPYRIEVIGSDGATNKITLNKVEEVLLKSNGCYFPFISQSIVMNYEGLSSYRATAKQFSYDTNTENLLEEIDLGEVANVVIQGQTFTDVGSDSVYTWMTYTNWGKPSDIKITSDSAGNSRLRETQMSYDSRGNLTGDQVWLDTTGAYVTTVSTSYDQYGNPVQATDAAGITTTTTYDSTYKQYPITQVTGTFTNQFAYDVRSGLTLIATDAKGLVASNSFDVFYRPTASYISTSAYGAPTLWKTKMSYSVGGISSGVSYNYIHKQVNDAVDTANGFETYTYLDGMGRTIQTRTEAETGQFRVANACYDKRGNPYFQTLPYFSSGTGITVISGTYLGTLTEFDSVGRTYRVTPAVQGSFTSGSLANTNTTSGDTGSPVGAMTVAFVDGSNPWAGVVTDSEGNVKKSYRDAYGRTVTITEVTSGENYNTHYNYDILGNLTNVTDNSNNSTVMAYDSLGRKTSMTDPDMGTWNYSYDNAGRMTQQIDARENKLTFSYNDQLGRLTSKQIYNSGNHLVGTISYIYDASDDPNYTVFKGQLYKVTDLQGYQRSGYDVRGRVIKTARFLDVNAMEYVTQSTYDDADRVQEITYPGNAATIKYSYDTAGNLIQVRSVAGTGTQEIFYTPQSFNALGQLTGYTSGNGVVTANTYFSNSKRLRNVLVKNGTNSLQNLSYTYDTVSDLKSINDGVYSGSASASVSSIAYDDLYRVKSLNSAARGTKTYAYNSIGNVLTNQDFGSGSYQYGSRPHAVTSANGKIYAYDACGNMTTRGGQTLAYDEQNQLIQVSATNTLVNFGYDDAGERLWRSGTNGYSVWIGGIYEINNGKVLCHVMAGGKRIATFESQCGGLWAKAFGEKNWYVASNKIQSALLWPFQKGRGSWTVFTGTWAGILGACMMAGRGVSLKRRERRKVWGQSSLWKQIVAVISISAFLAASTGKVEAQTYSPVFYYYHNDNLGSSNVLTDRSGSMVQHYEYATFGQTTYTDNTSVFPVSDRYTGQIIDDETGLYYYGARYYDPQLGRFIQPDTTVQSAATPQTLNRYAYCGNNPLNNVDPTGHFFFEIIIGIIIGAAIGAGTAAATGGNIGLGALTGAIGGLLGGLGAVAGGLAGGVAGGAIGGIVNAEITGGNIGYGALLGAIGGAITFGIGKINTSFGLDPDSSEAYWANGAANTAGGAAGGAIGAELYGGDPGKGALIGAGSGAGGFAFAQSLVTYFRGDTKLLHPEGGSDDPTGYKSLGTNGILGNESDAQAIANGKQGLFLFNKSQGPINDLLTAVWQKLFFGFGDANARAYASVAGQMPLGSFFYGHSQGALTVVNAGLYGSFPANSTFELDASPASHITARLYLGSSLTFQVHYFDPIAVVAPSLNLLKDASGIVGGALFPLGIHAHTGY
jgi:RHS repeat-associated protein